MSSVLNPFLYRALERYTGATVNVVNRGIPFKPKYRKHPVTGIWRRQRSDRVSEEYQCRCPFHPDSGKHLYVNHMFGIQDETTKDRHLDLAHCHHNCLDKQYELRKLLYKELYLNVSSRHNLVTALPFNSMSILDDDEDEEEVPIPGHIIPMDKLDTSHEAYVYMCSKRKYPIALLKHYGIGYCTSVTDRKHLRLVNRIYLPYIFQGKLVGWQGRYVGEPEAKEVAKYFTRPGLRKSKYLYNFDSAIRYPFVIITEGITDAWVCGKAAVSLLGKSLSDTQARLLVDNWKIQIVFFDIGAEKDSDEACSKLRANGAQNVLQLYPIEGFEDAGEMPPELIQTLILDKLKECTWTK